MSSADKKSQSNSRSLLTSNDKYSAVDRKSSPAHSSDLNSNQSEENDTSRFGESVGHCLYQLEHNHKDNRELDQEANNTLCNVSFGE